MSTPPKRQAAPGWRAEFVVPVAARGAFETLLESVATSVASIVEEEGRTWRIEAIGAGTPDFEAIRAALEAAAAAADIAVPTVVVETLPDVDWLARNRAQFPPVEAGRYFVHGSLYDGPVPAERVTLRLDASIAFGSGSHETTRGCLALLDRFAGDRHFRHPLDLGCGSGILAIAIAKTWRVPVLAVDVETDAVRLTGENAGANGVAGLVTAVEGAGFAPAKVRRAAPFDLIVANILAEPLVEMAPDLGRFLAPGGAAVLSGLLVDQEVAVVEACRAVGLAVADRIALGTWPTLAVVSTAR